MLSRNQLIASLLAVAFASGCSSSATLTTRDGSSAHGRIVRSDAKVVWVEGPSVEPEHAEKAIGRDVQVEVNGRPNLLGRLTADTEAEGTRYFGRMQWKRVCVEQRLNWEEVEQAPPTPACVPGDSVESVTLARAIERSSVKNVDPGYDSTDRAVLGIALGIGAIALVSIGLYAFANSYPSPSGAPR